MRQFFCDRGYMRSSVSHRQLDIGVIAHPDDIPDFKDPRLTYQVDMNKYQVVDMSNEQEIHRELMEGTSQKLLSVTTNIVCHSQIIFWNHE